jgi:hypothetical protein
MKTEINNLNFLILFFQSKIFLVSFMVVRKKTPRGAKKRVCFRG